MVTALFFITIGAVFGVSITYTYWKTFYVTASRAQGEALKNEYNKLLEKYNVPERLRIVRKR